MHNNIFKLKYSCIQLSPVYTSFSAFYQQMQNNADNSILAPWYIHPSHVVYGRYLHSMLPGSHTYFDNLVNLRCDHPPSYVDAASIHSGVVKPKAIRISNLRPFLNPIYPQHQAALASDYEQYRDRHGSTGYNINCLPQARHGVIAQPNAFYSNFPYLISCLSTIQHQHSTSTLDAERIFKEMFQGQMSFLNCKKMLLHQESDGATCNNGTDSTEASDLRLSLQPDYLKNKDCYWQSGRTSSTEALSKCLQVPVQLYTTSPITNSKVQEPKRHKTCIKKLKKKALNNCSKHFMVPFIGNTNKELIIKKRLDSPKSIITTTFPCKVKKCINRTEAVCLTDTDLHSHVSAESRTTVSESPQDSERVTSLRVNGELRKEATVVRVSQCPKDDENNQVLTPAAYQPSRACSVDDKKTFRCPQCRYLTDRKNNLKRHIMTMHQDSSKSLECCGVSFQNKAALRDHNSIFHRGGYRCQICSRNFCRKALLRRHLTVHSGQKDFFCDICGYATSHKSNLERHQKVHTKREPTIGGNRKSGTGKRGLRLGAASSLSHTILNSRVQSHRYEEPEETPRLSKYETEMKSLEADRALKQKSRYSLFIKGTPDNYMHKLQIIPSLKNTLHNYKAINFCRKGNYACDSANVSMQIGDRERSLPPFQLNTY